MNFPNENHHVNIVLIKAFLILSCRVKLSAFPCQNINISELVASYHVCLCPPNCIRCLWNVLEFV